MEIEKLQALVIQALEDVKAQDIVLFDTTNLTSLFERIVIASGNSSRQTKALAASVRDKIKEAGGDVISVEGEDTGEWVLVDLGDLIVHLMQPTIRNYYRLEEIWGGKQIDLETAGKMNEPGRKTRGKTRTRADTAESGVFLPQQMEPPGKKRQRFLPMRFPRDPKTKPCYAGHGNRCRTSHAQLD